MLMDRVCAVLVAAVLHAFDSCVCDDSAGSIAVHYPDWQFFVQKKFGAESRDDGEWTHGLLLDAALQAPSLPSIASRAPSRETDAEDDRMGNSARPSARRLIFGPASPEGGAADVPPSRSSATGAGGAQNQRKQNRGKHANTKPAKHRHRHRNRKERRRKKVILRPTEATDFTSPFDGGEVVQKTLFDVDISNPHMTSLEIRDQLVRNRSAQVLRKNIRIAPLDTVRRLLSDPQSAS